MGDRGNIVVDGIWFYTHWAGSDIKKILQTALKRKQRWSDSPYLARIIFSEMIKDDVDSETGYGLSLDMCDNENPILYVDVEKKTVKENNTVWTFEQFINQIF